MVEDAPWAELVTAKSKHFLYGGTKSAKMIEGEETMTDDGAKEPRVKDESSKKESA